MAEAVEVIAAAPVALAVDAVEAAAADNATKLTAFAS